MNLLYTLTAYPPSVGGAQLYAHMLAQQMQRNHQVQVVSLWDSNRNDWLLGTTLRAPNQSLNYTVDGVNVHRLGLSLQDKLSIIPFVLTYYPLMDLALPAISANLEMHLDQSVDQVDLVHNIRIGREPLTQASFYLAEKRNIPLVLTPLHHPRWVGWRYRAYIRLYTQADLVLALTNSEKHTLIEFGVCEDRIFVTGMGPVLAHQAHPKRFLEVHHIDGPMVLFLGQHYRYKGYREVLQAAQIVWKKVPDAHFVFIGPAVGRSEDVFKGISPDGRIHRLGMVDLQTKTDALAACALLCVPSTQESFGGVYTEAWYFSKPVIGCNIPSVAEVITDGFDGYLTSQSPMQIAEFIYYLLLNPLHAQTLGEAGHSKYKKCYTWSSIADQIERVYQKVI